MTSRISIVFVLAAVLQSVPLLLPAQSYSETAEVTADPGSVESAAEAGHRIPFDPALVGLPDFPYPLTSTEDYARAQELIEARLAELIALQAEGQPAATGEPREDGDANDTARGHEQGQDLRIVPLQALLLAVKRGAVLAARDRELDESLAKQRDQLDRIESQGMETSPPYPIALLDQLRAEHGLTQHSDEMLDQRRAQVQRQLDLSADGFAAAMRERRGIRDRLATVEDADDGMILELDLEVARINTLLALLQYDTAVIRQKLVGEEDALKAAQLALLGRKIALAQDDVVFAPEALESRLAEVRSREEALLTRMEALTSAGESAESALFQARQRLREEDPESGTEALRELIQALEEDLATARKGVEYRGQVKALAETARTLLKRRYSLLQGMEKDLWPAWLRETQGLLGEIGNDRDFALSELSALHSIELALSRRLAAPDLDAGVGEAVKQRLAANEVQSQLAEEMLLVQDQVRSLAQRLRLDLEPRVRERSLDQRLQQVQEKLTEWWGTEVAVVQDHGIYVRDAVTAISVFVLVLVTVRLLQQRLRRRLLTRPTAKAEQEEKRRTLRAVVSPLIRNTSQLFILIVAFYAAMAVSGLGQGKLQEWLWTLLILAFYFQIGIWANAGVVDFFKRKRTRMERNDPSAVTGYGLLLFFIRVGIWMMVGISVLMYFKYPVAGLIGALGVGGIAVAFAVQNILSDVFSSMAIILDKPFRVGDFVVAGEIAGVIENIGVKTTRIKSLSGEQVVVSNTDLLRTSIHNFKQMRERRVVFKIGVIYETPADTLERIPGIIAEVIRARPHARFDRAHFFAYGDFALVFEIVYYVYGADYNRYMDTQQAVNLGIYRRFQDEGISFAYPTQELILRRPAAPSPTPGAAS